MVSVGVGSCVCEERGGAGLGVGVGGGGRLAMRHAWPHELLVGVGAGLAVSCLRLSVQSPGRSSSGVVQLVVHTRFFADIFAETREKER